MTQTLKDAFWDRISDVRAGMFRVADGRALPMSPYPRRDDGAIWFITAEGTDVAKAAQSGSKAEFIVADAKARIYADVNGHVQQENDPAKLDELWNAVAAAWFDDGRRDDDVRLVRFTPETAEVWATDGAASFLYEITKANVSDDTPDMGDHGTVRFT